MAKYTIKVLKDGREVRQWEIGCSSGSDSDHVFVNDDGSESPVEWTEAESNQCFEEELAAFLDGWQERDIVVNHLWEPEEELPQFGREVLDRMFGRNG